MATTKTIYHTANADTTSFRIGVNNAAEVMRQMNQQARSQNQTQKSREEELKAQTRNHAEHNKAIMRTAEKSKPSETFKHLKQTAIDINPDDLKEAP